MKNVLATLVLLLMLCTAASAQNITFLPDPSATLIGVFPAQVGFKSGPNGEPIFGKTESSGQTMFLVGGFRTASGTVSYQIMSDSIHFTGTDPTLIDLIPTQMLYAALANEAVAQGTLLGYTSAPNCSAPATVRVYADACVSRTGVGLLTHFSPCDGLYSTWQFDVCMPQTTGAPQITFDGAWRLGDCYGSCEPTVVTGGQGAYRIQ